MNQQLVRHAIADQVGDRDNLDAVLDSELAQLRQPRHRAIVVHDFADDRRRRQSGDARQVNRGFGLAGPHQHAAFAGAQRKDVAGPRQVRGARAQVNRDLNRRRAVGGADAGGHTAPRFDRHAERRAARSGVLGFRDLQGDL